MFQYFKTLKIAAKIWILVALLFLGLIGSGVYQLFDRKAELLKEKELKTRHLVETAFSLLTHYQGLEQAGKLSGDDARQQAMAALKALRYEGKEYFWINDLGRPAPKMLAHPTVPALEGKVLDDAKFNKATSEQDGVDGKRTSVPGKNLFVAFVDVASRAGHGYVMYDWPKPKAGGGVTEDLYPKLSYVKKFEPWGWVVGSGIYIDDVDANFRAQAEKQLFIAAALLAVLGLVSAFMVKSIIAAIDKTASAMHDIAAGDGDLSKRLVPEAKGSLTALAEGFNAFAAKIEKTIVQVNECSSELSASASQLSETAHHTAEGVRRQEDDGRAVQAAVTQMTAHVQQVAENAASAVASAQQADSEAQGGKAVVDRTVAAILALAEDVKRADAVISELKVESSDIGSIVEVIREIADQTNLLALNAAIEAARAGEQGRGFAVVADEVRKLAQRTQEATAQIRNKIQTLQQGAESAADVMNTSRERAQLSVDQANEAGASLERITRAVDEITNQNAQIAGAAAEQSRMAEHITESLAGISAVAQETAQDARETQAATGQQAALVARLQALVSQFRFGQGQQSFNFDAAIAAHLAWKARLRSFLDGETTLTREQAVSHRHCALGKWYYGDGMGQFGHIQSMKDIEPPHEELHSTIARIVAAKEAGRKDEAEALFAKIGPLSQKIVGLLQETKRQVGG
ncbi:MAG: methyl-accepting chemotaxis protein [Actinomycetota bacterium]